MKNLFRQYMNFSRKNKVLFYTMRLLEAFIVALIIAYVFRLDKLETIVLVVIGLVLTPVGYFFADKNQSD